jgi:hypothetical protein
MRKHLVTIASRAGITAGVTGSPRHPNPKEMTVFAKTTLIAALALAGTSLTFVANASAGPGQTGWWQGSRYGEPLAVRARSLPYNPARQSPLCPPDHSLQECFYGG